MDFADVSARFKKRRDEQAPPEGPRNYEELHLLRARILGVLLRDARQARELSQAEVAKDLEIDPALLNDWEMGQGAPSLPQLELLAYALNVPVSYFWRNETLSSQEEARDLSLASETYIALRNRLIGVRLAVARKEAKLSQEELAGATGLTVEKVVDYEFGQTSAPFPELSSLASAVRRNIGYFLEGTGRLGMWLRLQEEYDRFSELPEDMRAFVSQPVNQPFIEIAMRLSQLPLNDLRTVGEKILDITL